MIHRIAIAMLLTLTPFYALADFDSFLIKHFESMGVDFTEPTRISFIFRVPLENQAALESKLNGMGYEVTLKVSQHPIRMVSATVTMQVTSEALQEHRQELAPLAREFKAIFDGWGTGRGGTQQHSLRPD